VGRHDDARRQFLVKTAQGAAVAATGGLVWAYLLKQESKAAPFALRPPGALAEADFGATCIKCGQCVVDCPFDTLRLAAAGEGVPIGTPHFEPRQIPCYMCEDIPCTRACPTGALDPGLEDVRDSRMGTAVVDQENCLSWLGLRCEICVRDCPVTGVAITTENHPRRISKHAMFVPVVHGDACTGCGVCEKVCPTEVAAIRVLPAELIKGRIGEHYRLGWEGESSITDRFEPGQSEAVQPDADAAVDYLNQDLL
jgi:ferredoxin-type protein NapG